jgi:hypothetical protein
MQYRNRPVRPAIPNPEGEALGAALRARWGAMTPEELHREIMDAIPELAPRIKVVRPRGGRQ